MIKFFKIIFYNFLVLIGFLTLIEVIFGYWFDKDNFGPYMREHRMKNQRIEWTNKDEKIVYFYRRNYHGFRGEDIDPSNIKAIIMGGSVIDERYKPDKYTITEFINNHLIKEFDIKLFNAGIEAQTTNGMVKGFKHWLNKIENFSPKFILFYIGINDLQGDESADKKDIKTDGHLINPNKKEIFIDNIKSRSIIYDSARIFKFKYLPRKGFIKYDGKLDNLYLENYKFIDYKFALKNYDKSKLQQKYNLKIRNYLYRVDVLAKMSKAIGSTPIFITNINSGGHAEKIFVLNYSLIKHCKLMKYQCIDMAKNINGKVEYWIDGSHTTKIGSEAFANEIYIGLKKILNQYN